MNPTSEILERVNKSSSEHHDGVFTRLFRYLLREDIYFAAYQKLYANSGAMTWTIVNKVDRRREKNQKSSSN
jgi:RNA-directed DNA polymerase